MRDAGNNSQQSFDRLDIRPLPPNPFLDPLPRGQQPRSQTADKSQHNVGRHKRSEAIENRINQHYRREDMATTEPQQAPKVAQRVEKKIDSGSVELHDLRLWGRITETYLRDVYRAARDKFGTQAAIAAELKWWKDNGFNHECTRGCASDPKPTSCGVPCDETQVSDLAAFVKAKHHFSMATFYSELAKGGVPIDFELAKPPSSAPSQDLSAFASSEPYRRPASLRNEQQQPDIIGTQTYRPVVGSKGLGKGRVYGATENSRLEDVFSTGGLSPSLPKINFELKKLGPAPDFSKLSAKKSERKKEKKEEPAAAKEEKKESTAAEKEEKKESGGAEDKSASQGKPT